MKRAKKIINDPKNVVAELLCAASGVAAFAGLGDVEATPRRFDLGNFKYSYDLGLRFVLDPSSVLTFAWTSGSGRGRREPI